MPITTAPFTGERAPCGQFTAGERLQDRDEQCLVTDVVAYVCGCRDERHEFHDGSVSRTVMHHDGTILVDELIAER